MFKKCLFFIVCLVPFMLSMPVAASPRLEAQAAGTITYGSSVTSNLSAVAPSQVYAFNGNAGDLVRIKAFSTSGNLDPQLTLVDATQQPLITVDDDAFSLNPLDATISTFLPTSGIYGIVITAVDNTEGAFALVLQGRAPVQSSQLLMDQPITVTIPLTPNRQYFSFEASACPVTLTATNLTAGYPYSYPYVVKLRDQTGHVLDELRGGRQLEDRTTVTPNSGRYEVEVTADAPITEGQLILTITCQEDAPTCVLPILGPPVPATPTPTPTPPAGQTLLIQSGGTLAYNTSTPGAVLPTAPMVQYTFNGTVGDLIEVEVMSVSAGYDPNVLVMSPSGQPVGGNDDDIYGITETDAGMGFLAKETGIYSLFVSGENGSGGSYLLRLFGRAPVSAIALAPGIAVTVDVPPLSPTVPPPNVPQFFMFDALECPTALNLRNLTSDFPFAVIVRDEEGHVIGKVRGGQQIEDRLIVAPLSGKYEVEVLAADKNVQGQLELLVTCAESAPLCPNFSTPVSTPVIATPTPTATVTGTISPTPTGWIPPCPTDTPLVDGTPTPTPQTPILVVPQGPPIDVVLTLLPQFTQTPEVEILRVLQSMYGSPPEELLNALAAQYQLNPDLAIALALTPTLPILVNPQDPTTATPTVTASPTPCNTATPTISPTPTPYCGDGICQDPYSCSCALDCANHPVWNSVCIPSVTPTPPPFCGDGICNEPFDCNCRGDCANNPDWIAYCIPTLTPTPPPFCGDGICNEPFNCDCTVDCANNPDWIAYCEPTVAPTLPIFIITQIFIFPTATPEIIIR